MGYWGKPVALPPAPARRSALLAPAAALLYPFAPAGSFNKAPIPPIPTVSLRIWALIAQGQFAEAQVLIAESTAAGLIEQQQAARMLERIALLNTRLGQIPARGGCGQRAGDA